MYRTAIIALVAALAFTFTTAHAGFTISMDAADRDIEGNPITPHIRLMADNTDGTENLTNVRFTPEIHGGILSNGRMVSWADPNNPWFGAREADNFHVTQGNIRYSIGNVLYPDNSFAPNFECQYLSGHANYIEPPDELTANPIPEPDPFTMSPDDEGYDEAYAAWLVEYLPYGEYIADLLGWDANYNSFSLRGEVPVGMNWDFTLKMIAVEGTGPIDLFSVAGGEVRSDQGTWTLEDADRTPQSIPEPTTLGMLVAGAAGLVLRRKT